MRVVVVGAGGMGLYFAARLAIAQHSVTLLGRPSTARAYGKEPLTLRDVHGTATAPREYLDVVGAIDDVEVAPDLILVAVKAWQVAGIAEALIPSMGSETVVLTLQNGVDAPRAAADSLGGEHVLGGTCVVIAQRTGVLEGACVGSDASVEIGPLRRADQPSGNAISLIRQCLEKSGIAVTVNDDIEHALWRKLMLVGSYGGVGALARKPTGMTSTTPETYELVKAAMEEVRDVANAYDVAVTDSDVAAMMDIFSGFEPSTTASMQRDLIDGRPSELAEQIGAVVRYGEQCGVFTPIYRTILASQLPSENFARGGAS